MSKTLIHASIVVTLCSTFLNATRGSDPIVVKPNGGWCWFQGERAVVVDGKVIFTSISGDDHGDWTAGDLVATSFDPRSNEVKHFALHRKFHQDDHDVAGLCVLPDKRLLAVFGKHGNDHSQRWRITQQPADIRDWTDENTFDIGAAYTYSNVYSLAAENNHIYNFHRGRGYNPNCTVSDDGGVTWR